MITTVSIRLLVVVVAFQYAACKRPESDPNRSSAQGTEAAKDLVASDPIRFLEEADAFWMTPCILGADPKHHIGESLQLAMLAALQRDSAVADFERMLRSDDEVSVLYGLVGLYFCDPFHYQDHVRRVQKRLAEKSMNDQVASVPFAADLPGESVISELLNLEGADRIEYGQTLTEHCLRKKQPISEIRVDFFGGGIPLHFLDPGVISAYNEELQEKPFTGPDGELRVIVNVGEKLAARAEFLRVWAGAFKRMLDKAEQEAQVDSHRLAQMSLEERLRHNGFSDIRVLKVALTQLKTAARNNDRKKLVEMVRFPFPIFDRGIPTKKYENAAQLLDDFDLVFSKRVIESLSESSYESLYVRDRGAMIGSGQVWLKSYEEGIRIEGINP
jgi:hypothetical protein